MGLSRQEYWSGLPFPSLGDLPDPGIQHRSLALQADSLLSELQGHKDFHSLTGPLALGEPNCHVLCTVSSLERPTWQRAYLGLLPRAREDLRPVSHHAINLKEDPLAFRKPHPLQDLIATPGDVSARITQLSHFQIPDPQPKERE